MAGLHIDGKFVPLRDLPLRPSAATKKYGFQKPPPGPIDRWLSTNARSPTVGFLRDYLLLENPAVEHVICFIERECTTAPDNNTIFKDPDTHTLYITARVPHGAKRHLLLRQSPRAILERFVGSNNDPAAPEWTRWTHPTLEFQQPKASFANLFVRMAAWEENKLQPGLPFKMSQWARSVLIESRALAKSDIFRPITPRKVRIIQNVRSHKRHSTLYGANDYDLRSPTKGNSSLDQVFTVVKVEGDVEF